MSSIDFLFSECVFSKRDNPQQRLLKEMFDSYDSDSLSYNVDPKEPSKPTGVKMKFGAKLVRIISVVSVSIEGELDSLLAFCV